MVVVALSTGMRQGELLGLEWGHIVWEHEEQRHGDPARDKEPRAPRRSASGSTLRS